MLPGDEEYESAFNDASGETVEPVEVEETLGDDETTEPTEPPEGETLEGEEVIEGEEVDEGETTEGEEVVEGAPEGEPTGEAPATEQPPAPVAPAAEQPPAQKGGFDEEALASAYRRLRDEEQQTQQTKGGDTQQVSPLDKTWKDYVSDEDKTLIDEYESEWGEVSRAEEIKRQAQLQHVQDVVYSNVRSALAPIVEQLQQSKVEAHFTSIRSRVPEFDEIREPVQVWVKEQPEFVRPAFEQVLKEGSADQVVELLNAYKQATGKTGAVPEIPASSASKEQQPAARVKRPAPSGAAKRALAAAPSQKRTNPPTQADPEDFSSAFDEAAAGGI